MPQFYDPLFSEQNPTLSREESHHCISVLRHKIGDEIKIINGIGGVYTGIISDGNKNGIEVKIEKYLDLSNQKPKSIIAIAPVKSSDRIEWFIEKSTEIGVGTIIFIQTKRSVRTKIKLERIEKKTISALKQSENVFMPSFLGPVDLKNLNTAIPTNYSKYVAHISDNQKTSTPGEENAIVIGPEGGFDESEVKFLLNLGFEPLSLGKSILRTETAGVVSAFLFANS